MRLIVMFDLPVESVENKRDYRVFRKFLVNEGFIMMQESIYCKLLLNSTNLNLLVDRIKKHKPQKGLVQLLKITEKQYSEILYLTGSKQTKIEESDSRLVII